MRGTRPIRQIMPRMLALAVIAGALLMRMMVPQGWMPVETAGGWRITLCSGSGPMTMPMPDGMMRAMAHHGADKRQDHGADKRQDHGAADHPCPFSSLAMALDEPPLPALDPPALPVAPWRASLALFAAVGRGLAAPPPPATGPPLIP